MNYNINLDMNTESIADFAGLVIEQGENGIYYVSDAASDYIEHETLSEAKQSMLEMAKTFIDFLDVSIEQADDDGADSTRMCEERAEYTSAIEWATA